MKSIKEQALELIQQHLKRADLEEIASLPIKKNGKCYSIVTISEVRAGRRNNEKLLKIMLDKVETKYLNLKEKVDRVEQITNGN